MIVLREEMAAAMLRNYSAPEQQRYCCGRHQNRPAVGMLSSIPGIETKQDWQNQEKQFSWFIGWNRKGVGFKT